MSQVVSRIWKPVRRKGAERYLQLIILSFAASVSLTRLILELTGYPQLGNGSLHIAHVLYGGVLLFISSILPLMRARRQFYINQFSTIIIAAYQYIVLQSLYFYDRKYVRKQRKHMPSSL